MKTKKPINFWLLMLIIFTPFILLFLWIDSTTPDPVRERNYAGDSWVACKGFIRQSLKAPSTAEFQEIDFNQIQQVSDHFFEMTIAVDAENSFGAKLRGYYYCKTYFQDDTWYLADLRQVQR